MVAQPAYSSPPTPNRGSTRWRIAARQISTTRVLSRFASRPSRTNLSMTQNKSAPTTTMISTLIRTKSMVFPLLARECEFTLWQLADQVQKIIACAAGHERKQWSEKFHLQACCDSDYAKDFYPPSRPPHLVHPQWTNRNAPLGRAERGAP